MKRHTIYFVDEDEPARRANLRDLTALLDNPAIQIRDLAPLKTFAEYDALAADPATAAFILDQRMKTGGTVSYNGTDLAAHLRGIDAKMPIYILTGYADQIDDFRGSEHLVEYIIDKEHIENPASEKAKIVKARLLRHLNVFNDVRDERAERFHSLLVKSLRQPLTSEEHEEMDFLEGVTSTPVAAAALRLGEVIDELKKITGGEQLPL